MVECIAEIQENEWWCQEGHPTKLVPALQEVPNSQVGTSKSE